MLRVEDDPVIGAHRQSRREHTTGIADPDRAKARRQPVLNGLDMMRYIRALNPFVKTIYVSGAVREFRALLEFEREEFGAAVLDKPFSSEKLFTLLGRRPADTTERERRL